jgi:DNA polymerase-3 subunit delta
MQLKFEQLTSHLQRNGLAPIYLLSGDEPLQLLEASDLIRRRASQEGAERNVLIVDRAFDWDQLSQASANLSLFSSKQLTELRVAHYSPGKPGGDALTAYAENPPVDTCLLITMDKLDKRSQQARWFKALDKVGVFIQIWPVEPSRLPAWIVQRLQQLGKRIDKNAATLIAERTEGNLLAAKQELDKLCLLVNKQDITLEDVQNSVIDSTRHDAFALIEHALLGNAVRVASMLRGLQSEGVEPISIYGALMWEFRRLCSISALVANGMPRDKAFTEFRVWNQRQTAVNSVLARLDTRALNQLLAESIIIDKSLKGMTKRSPWETLENFLFRIAGLRLQSAAIN